MLEPVGIELYIKNCILVSHIMGLTARITFVIIMKSSKYFIGYDKKE